jgi:F420-0:gamma-glutamyl ligase-like protein
MSIRDYFAGQVIPELIRLKGADVSVVIECASKAYEIADAMLCERAK